VIAPRRAGRTLVPLVLAIAGCRPDCTPSSAGPAPIVLLVTVDTCRADHLGAYGSQRVRTPNVDRLAAEGTVFENTYSAVNVTLPSHLSMLTSLPAAIHRVTSNHSQAARPVETLHARLRAAGYRVAAFVSAIHLGPTRVLGSVLHDLDRFDAPRRASRPWQAEETTDHLLHWLRGACREPTFAWMHLWDPHMPYTPPAPFDDAYYQGDPRNPRHASMQGVQLDWTLHDLHAARRHLQRVPRLVRTLKQTLGVSSRGARGLILDPAGLRTQGIDDATYGALFAIRTDLHRTLPLHPEIAGFLTGIRDVDYPRALYAGEISYVDHEIGRLRDTLEAWGIADRVVLMVTGDHGEGLGEHGIYFNHIGLWDEMLHVPLVVWAPGRVRAERRSEIASGLDVAPTLLGLVGLPPAPAMEGGNLFDPAAPHRRIVAEAVHGDQITLRDDSWKVVRTLHGYYTNDAFHPETGQLELYDLSTDPAERTNVATARPDVAQTLTAALDTWLDTHGVGPGTPGYTDVPAPRISPDDRARLRALGYIQ
jgi:arylsulfatase A-like enzyme